MPQQCPSYIIQKTGDGLNVLRCASELDDICEHLDAGGDPDRLSVPVSQTYLSIGGSEHEEHAMDNALDRDGFYANHERKSVQAIDKLRILGQVPDLGTWYKIIFIEQRRRDYETLAKIGKVLNAGGHVLTLSPYRYEGYSELAETPQGHPVMDGRFCSIPYGWGSYDDYIPDSPVPEGVQLYGYSQSLAAAVLSIVQLGYGLDAEYQSFKPSAKKNLLANSKELADDIETLYALLSGMGDEMAVLCENARTEGKLADAGAYGVEPRDASIIDEWRYKWRPITGRSWMGEDNHRLEFVPFLTGWQDESALMRRSYDYKAPTDGKGSITPAAEELLEAAYAIAASVREMHEHSRKCGAPMSYDAMPLLERRVDWGRVTESFSGFFHATELSSMTDALLSGVPLQDILA